MKRKYKGGRKAISFKNLGTGLSSSERRIAEQSKTKVDALKTLQLQSANIDKLQIGGLQDKHRFEEGVQNSKFQLNEMSRDLIVENQNIRADRDVKRLRGIADEYGRKAQHLAQLAPKQAKAYSDIITGIGNFTEALEYQELSKSYNEKGTFDLRNNEEIIARADIQKSSLEAKIQNYEEAKKLTLEQGLPITQENLEANGLITSNERFQNYAKVRGKSNDAREKDLLDDFSKNKQFYKSNIKQFWTQDLKGSYNKNSVTEIYEFAAYEHLKHWGISPNSRGGKQLIDNYRKFALLDRNRLVNNENAGTTASVLHQNHKLLRAEQNLFQKQLLFNEGVYATTTGTFKHKNKFVVGIDNKADAAQEYLSDYLKVNWRDFSNASEVTEWAEQFIIMDLKKLKTSGPTRDDILNATPAELRAMMGEEFGIRHPTRVIELTEDWAAYAKKEKTLKSATTVAEDEQNVADSNKRFSDHVVNKERGYKIEVINGEEKQVPYDLSDEKFWTNEIEIASNLSKGSNQSKQDIYRRAADTLQTFGANQWTVATRWSRINNFLLDGNHEQALIEFNSASKEQKEKLRPSFEIYQKLFDSGWNYKNLKGVQGLNQKTLSVLKAVETANKGNKQLSPSAESIQPEMMNRILQKFYTTVTDKKYQGTPLQAMETAIGDEMVEFQQGVNNEQPDQYGTGFYARRRGYYNDSSGTKLPWYEYRETNFGDTDSSNRALLVQLRERSADGTLAEAIEARNIRLSGEHSPETVRLLTKFGKVSYEDWVNDDYLISPNKVTRLANIAKRLADYRGLSYEEVAADVPANIRTLAYLTGKTDIEVVNDILARHGHKVAFLPNAQDAARINSQGRLVQALNLDAENYWQAARVQGVTPLQPWIRKTVEEGKDVSQSFLESIGVEPYTDQFGNQAVSNYTTFLNNDGISRAKLSWEQIAPVFGLTGIQNTKKQAYLLDRLKESLPTKNNK